MKTQSAQNDNHKREWVELTSYPAATLLRLHSQDGMNRLSRAMLKRFDDAIGNTPRDKPLIVTGNQRFFSAGADLHEIAALKGPEAYDFAKMGQVLMNAIDYFPGLVCAAIEGYCLGGGLDLALACDVRIAAPNAIFGHRGSALGLITGWGGTQRLPRLVGKGRALQMFCAAEKIDAALALEIGLVNMTAADPLQEAIARLNS